MGSLEIIMGPMFSGKTELLIEKFKEEWPYQSYIYCANNNYKLAINYFKDTRYGSNVIASHSAQTISSTNLKTLSEFINDTDKINAYTHIFINEAQFFPDLKECVIKLVEVYHKHVIICGLDSDFKREKFGDIWDLIPHANNIIKLKGKCNNCDNYSLFTHRVSNEEKQEIIGTNNYIPLCRQCYIQNN